MAKACICPTTAGGVERHAPPARAPSRLAIWEPADADGARLRPAPDRRGEAGRPRFHLCPDQVRRRNARCMIFGEAYGVEAVALQAVQRVRPRPGAVQSLYRRARQLRRRGWPTASRPMVFEDGQQRRDFVHVEDVAHAFRLALESRLAAGRGGQYRQRPGLRDPRCGHRAGLGHGQRMTLDAGDARQGARGRHPQLLRRHRQGPPSCSASSRSTAAGDGARRAGRLGARRERSRPRRRDEGRARSPRTGVMRPAEAARCSGQTTGRSWSPAAAASSAPTWRRSCSTKARRSWCFDNLSRPGVERNLDWLRRTLGAGIAHCLADIRDAARSTALVRHAKAVFHFAAQIAVTTSLVDPMQDFAVNARGHADDPRGAAAAGRRTPLIFASTNKVYGALDDVALEQYDGPPCPARRAAAPSTASTSAAAGFLHALWLLQGRGGSVRARLCAVLRVDDRGAAHELHLRAAPVRHRGPGLGRAFPLARAARRADHHLWRRQAGARHPARRGRGCGLSRRARRRSARQRPRLQPRRRAGQCGQPDAACSTRSPRVTGREVAVQLSRGGAQGDQLYFVADTRRLGRGDRLARPRSAGATGCATSPGG